MPGTGARGTGTVSPRDLTGTRDRQLRAQAKANKDAAALTDDDLVLLKHEVRTQGHKAGFTEGFRSGWSAGLNLVIDAGLLTEQQVVELVNSEDCARE